MGSDSKSFGVVLDFLISKNTGMPRPVFPLVFLVALPLGGCERRATTSVDSWARPGASRVEFDKGERLEDSRLHIVPESMESQAEVMLSDVSCLELSAEQIQKLLPHPLPVMPRTKAFLTRGVFLNRDTGHFSVTVLDDKLWVHHGCLGRHAVPMKRQALVIQLERMPKEVYVGCSMAE